MLDAGLLPRDLAFRLFGTPQFAWYRDFLLPIGERINDANPDGLEVRWVNEIRSLASKW